MCSPSMWNIIITRGIIKAKATRYFFLQSAEPLSRRVRFSVVSGLVGCSNTTNERPREFFDHTGWLWYSAAQFGDFELTLEWKATRRADNSGVSVRFPDPLGEPRNAVAQGYEVQIDDLGAP